MHTHTYIHAYITPPTRTCPQKKTIVQRAKLFLVDLAGSEKWDKSIESVTLGVYCRVSDPEGIEVTPSSQSLRGCSVALVGSSEVCFAVIFVWLFVSADTSV